ncbi:hypothetical protein GCM10023149_47900 [Mucilaginibacter gynuensis]|uniref:CAAX prenyl protease 2/Lysostaphin resistance protein A-like domain-containing protein n=2 Tax=Mucilaginibacter gynuensis TaxID=1302236 RepID=A0ABP8HE40_9SPHI
MLISVLIIKVLYGMDVFSQAMAISPSSPPEAISALKILLAIGNTLFIFFVPALFFAYLVVHDAEEYLKPSIRFPWLLIPLVLVIMFISSPTMELLTNINMQLKLPSFLKGVENWMRESEEESQRIIEVVLKMRGPGDLISGLVIVALLPAVAEEFLFRGCLQTIFHRWTGRTHSAIWITAILFSTFHLQFFGFLPRVLLGALFGYMVAWSGSIWPSVWAHFINNGTAVIWTYMYQHKQISIDVNDEHIFNYTGYIISLIFLLFLLWIYKKIAIGKNRVAEY